MLAAPFRQTVGSQGARALRYASSSSSSSASPSSSSPSPSPSSSSPSSSSHPRPPTSDSTASASASASTSASSAEGQGATASSSPSSPLTSADTDAPSHNQTTAQKDSRNFAKSQSVWASEQNKLPLPWLDRPLGAVIKPLTSGVARTPSERTEAYLASGRMEERKQIVKTATRGYFYDFHSLRSHGGKTWMAPSTMIRSDRSLWFPTVQGTCLADKKTRDTAELFRGKVSVVCILNSRISEEHTKSFYQPTLDLHGDNNSFQLVQVNLQPNLLKHYLISLFLSSLRSQIPPKLHKTYFLSKLDPQAVVTNLVEDPSGNNPPLSTSTTRGEELGIHNKHVGYTYLVDPDGKIRWAGCGFAEGEEREALLNCTSLLLDRVGGRK